MPVGRRQTLTDVMAAGMVGNGGIQPSGQPGSMPPEALVAPSGRYSKLADALLASAAGAKPKGWGDLLNAGGDLALGYTLANKEDDKQKTYSSKLSQMLSGAKTPEAMTQAALSSGDDNLVKAAVAERLKPPPKADSGRYKFDKDVGIVDGATGQVMKTLQELGISPAARDKPQEVNGRLVQQQPDGTFKEVYTSPPKPTQLQAADKKEIIESDQAAQAGKSAIMGLNKALGLNDTAYSGPLAETRGYISSLFGAEGGKATEDVKNIITTQALDQLKAVFGGMPTEGERQILLDIQGSTSQAPEVRKGIWERAIDMAERRIDFNQRQSGALRSGDYYQPGYSPVTPDAAPAQPAPPAGAPTAVQPPKGPPAPAVQFLQSQPTPEVIAQFDAKYGPGAARAILGRPQMAPQPEPAQPEFGPSVGAY